MNFTHILLPPLNTGDEWQDRLSWLALLRWLNVSTQILIILIGTQLLFIPIALSPIMLGLSLALGMGNLLACWQSWQTRSPELRQRELFIWMLVDLVQFIILISLTRGLHNPFYPLIYAYAVLGSVLLPGFMSWGYLLVLVACIYFLNPVVYVFNSQMTFVRLSSLVSGGIQIAVLSMIWGVSGAVSRRLLALRQRAERLQARQQSLQRVHLLGAMGAGVAHEFATPLNTLRLRLERLRRREAPDASGDLQAALQALSQCEQRLKALAQLPDRQSLEDFAPLYMVPQIESQLQSLQVEYPDLHVSFEYDCPAEFSLALPELALTQSLQNLLQNAAQAVQGQGKIQVRLTKQNQKLELWICDNGPGWPDSVQRHLGEPFITTRQGGTGLGLYTVYILAQSLGGELILSPHQAQGACACLKLPIPN